MTHGKADLRHAAATVELGEDDAEDFRRRLGEFRDALPDAERSILSQMVVDAAGEKTGTAAGNRPAPTEADVDSFIEKVNRFHDELPGDQHLYVDRMLAKTVFKEDAEVQGYRWIGEPTIIRNKDLAAYREWCYAAGGEWVRWRRIGPRRLRVACYDYDHDRDI